MAASTAPIEEPATRSSGLAGWLTHPGVPVPGRRNRRAPSTRPACPPGRAPCPTQLPAADHPTEQAGRCGQLQRGRSDVSYRDEARVAAAHLDEADRRDHRAAAATRALVLALAATATAEAPCRLRDRDHGDAPLLDRIPEHRRHTGAQPHPLRDPLRDVSALDVLRQTRLHLVGTSHAEQSPTGRPRPAERRRGSAVEDQSRRALLMASGDVGDRGRNPYSDTAAPAEDRATVVCQAGPAVG